MKRRDQGLASYLLWTTALVVAVMAVVASYFFVYGKSAVWEVDGLGQHYPALFAFNEWVRGILASPQSGVPLWSWNMGLGADIIGTLSWPVLGDPFALVSLAFPMARLEWAYATMLALRVIAAGITSALYFRKMGARPLPGATAVVLYLFGSFLLVQGRHPYFINALVFLPLLLLGIELALRDRKAWPLTVFVALAAAANYYFFYTLTIVTVLYAVARYLELTPRGERLRRLPITAARVGGFYVLGIALAAPLLLPSAAAVLGTDRSGSEFVVPLLYPAWVYLSQLGALASSYMGARSTFLGFGYLAWMITLVLFMRRGRNSAVKFMIVAFAVFVAVPWFGSAFNGFTFPSNRFAFAWGLFLALGAALTLSEDEPLGRHEILAMAAVLGVYAVPLVALARTLSLRLVLPSAFGVLTLGVFVLDYAMQRSKRIGHPEDEGRPATSRAPFVGWALLAIVVANVSLNATLLYAPRFGNVIKDFEPVGVQRRFERNLGSVVGTLPRGGFYRVDNTATIRYNSGMVQGFPNASFYFSTMDGDLTRFRRDIESRPGWSSFSYDGFDDRAYPTTLAGVKYYLAKRGAGARARVPFGFDRVERTKRGDVYRNRYALPLGFLYETAVDRSDFERLDPADRQVAMLRGAVVDDGVAPQVPRIEPAREATELPFTVESQDGARLDLDAGRIVRDEPDSSIVLSIRPVTDAELYVEIAGFDNVKTFGGRSVSETDSETASRQNRERFAVQPDVLSTDYRAGRVKKYESWRTPQSPYYWGNRTQLVNLGYQRGEVTTISIAPRLPGVLTFDSLKVLALPMRGYRDAVTPLRERPLRDLVMRPNSVSGMVSARNESLLFLSIPFSEGWSATVDGRPVELVRANSGFSALPVAPGEHQVELRYFTPGLKAGLIVAALAIVGIAVGAGVRAWRRRGADRH